MRPGKAGFLDLHFTLVAGLLFGVSLLILTITGLTQRPFVPMPDSVWTSAMAQPEVSRPWWDDDRVQAMVLLALTVALVVLFR